MAKICPFLISDGARPELGPDGVLNCVEEQCAWFICNQETRGCAVAILTAIVHDVALVRYPTLAGKRRS